MYLESLDINGFKSFAEKTELTFMPVTDGRYSITAIVGPNGSGKSNIADAIRWVLGEQSLKTLRGKKSEDVIFAGSAGKSKLGLASVSLTIDNTDARLPLPHDTVVITRRLYRSGESEYIINNQPVRLFDVELLLARGQFGHGSYSIIGQGMIERMVLQTPAERLVFFDEASGIKELQLKRHHAGLKLARTEEHLAQATLLLGEVAPRLKTLARQVKKLEERQVVEERLRTRQEQYYATLWGDIAGEMGERRAFVAALSNRGAVLVHDLMVKQHELKELRRADREDGEWSRLQTVYQNILHEERRLEQERTLLQGKIQTGYRDIGGESLAWLKEKQSDGRAAVATLRAEADLLAASGKELEIAVAEKKKNLEREEAIHAEEAQALRATEAEILAAKSEREVSHLTGWRAVQAILESRDQFPGVHGVVAHLGRVEKKFQMAIEVAVGANISSIVVTDDRVAEACIEYLRRGELGVATFLPLNTLQPRPVPPQLKDEEQRAGVYGVAMDFISYDVRFTPVFLQLFGTTLIVEDLAVARAIGMGRMRMVTIRGDLVERNGSMKGGYRRERAGGLSFSSASRTYRTEKELESWQGRLAEQQQQLRAREQQIRLLEKELQQAETDRLVAEQKLALLTAQIEARETDVAAVEQELTLGSPDSAGAAAKLLRDFTARQTEIERELIACQAEAKKLAQALTTAQSDEAAKKEHVFVLQDEVQAAQSAYQQLLQEKSQEQIALAKVETRAEAVTHEIAQELNTVIETIVQRGVPSVLLSELPAAESDIQKLKYQLSLIGGIDPDVSREFAETSERHESLGSQVEDLTKAMADLSKLVAELDDMMKKKRGAAFGAIKKEFSRYFTLLFGGGKAELVEVYGPVVEEADGLQTSDFSHQTLDSSHSSRAEVRSQKSEVVGIEIIATPPGKKATNLHALSGGERTLTALALLSAILRTNPSPFVLLDEVEAALDEANTVRFTAIVRELSAASQFILITHNRVTMHAADALYGVTMKNDGISRLTSVRLAEVATA